MKSPQTAEEKEYEDSLLEDVIRRSPLQTLEAFGMDKEVIFEILGFGGRTGTLVTQGGNTESSERNKFAQLAPHASAYLYSIADLKIDVEDNYYMASYLLGLVKFIGRIHTLEAYQGLAMLLNRLLTENLNLKHFLLTQTVLSLAEVSVGLDRKEAVPMLTSAVSHLQNSEHELSLLAEYFDRLDAPEGIEEILTHHAGGGKMPELEAQCLALIRRKHA